MNLAMHDKPILDANLESARSYWLRRLSGGVAPSSIVQDANRAPNADPRREAVEVAGLQSTELAALTKGSPFLLFTFLTAALDVCIHRHTGDETIVLGSPAPADLGRPNAVTIVERICPSRSDTV